MRCYWRQQRRGEFDHEAVWGALVLGALAAARLFPFDRVPVWVCWFHRLSGLPCPGCGSTRAFVDLAHGRWTAGFALNPLAGALFLMSLCYVPYAAWVVIAHKPRLRATPMSPRERRTLFLALIAIVFANWVYLVLVGR